MDSFDRFATVGVKKKNKRNREMQPITRTEQESERIGKEEK